MLEIMLFATFVLVALWFSGALTPDQLDTAGKVVEAGWWVYGGLIAAMCALAWFLWVYRGLRGGSSGSAIDRTIARMEQDRRDGIG